MSGNRFSDVDMRKVQEVRAHPASIQSGCALGIAGEPLEIIQHGGDESLSSRVLAGKRSGEKSEQITGLLGRFLPIGGRRCDQLRFQFILPQAQRSLIGLDLRQQATQLGRLLSNRPTMLIQIDRLVGHDETGPMISVTLLAFLACHRINPVGQNRSGTGPVFHARRSSELDCWAGQRILGAPEQSADGLGVVSPLIDLETSAEQKVLAGSLPDSEAAASGLAAGRSEAGPRQAWIATASSSGSARR